MKSIRDYALKLNIEEKEYFISNITQNYRSISIQLTTNTNNVLKRKNKKTLNSFLDDLLKYQEYKITYKRRQVYQNVNFDKFKINYIEERYNRTKSEYKQLLKDLSDLLNLSDDEFSDSYRNREIKLMVLERKLGEHRGKLFKFVQLKSEILSKIELKKQSKLKKQAKSKKPIVEPEPIDASIEIIDASFNFRKFKLDKIISSTDEE